MSRQRGPSIRYGGWRISLRSLVSLRWKNGLPRLVVHEKYEPVIKWVLRILTAVSVLSGLVALTPVGGLALGVVLLVVEQFFERAVFEYSTIYVLPHPDFPFRSESWVEMAYALPADRVGFLDRELPSICALAFDDRDQAHGVMRLLHSWATGPDGNGVNNLVLSFVFEDFGGYSVYVYPDLASRDLKSLFEETRQLQLEEKLTKKQQELVMFFKLGKYFKLGEASMLHRFVDRQQRLNSPYLLGCFMKRDGGYDEVDRELWIPMTELRIKKRGELGELEVEWEDPRAIRRAREGSR